MINIHEVDALVVGRRLELGVDLLHALHEAVALLLQLAARAVLARVEPLAVRGVDGLRRRRPASPPRHTRPTALAPAAPAPTGRSARTRATRAARSTNIFN